MENNRGSRTRRAGNHCESVLSSREVSSEEGPSNQWDSRQLQQSSQ